MTIKLYNNSAENNRVDKTAHLSNELVVSSVILKDGTSVVRPSLLLSMTSVPYNYLYIEEFSRYYFIVNIASIRDGLWRVDCRVDVLMSFKTPLYLNVGTILRNEYDIDDMVIDDLAQFKVTNDIRYIDTLTDNTCKDLSEELYYYPLGDNLKCRNIIVVLASHYNISERNSTPENPSRIDDSNVPSTLPVDDAINLPEIKSLKTGAYSSMYYAMSPFEYINFALSLQDKEEYASYVNNVFLLPYEVENRRYVNNIPPSQGFDIENKILINNNGVLTTIIDYSQWSATSGTVFFDKLRLPTYNVSKIKVADFTYHNAFGESYLDYDGYTDYELYCPYYGYVKLNYDDFYNQNIRVYYMTSMNDGSTTLVIYNVTKQAILFQATVNMTVKLSLNASNAHEIEVAKTATAIQSAVGSLGSLLMSTASALTGNVPGLAVGVAGIMSNGASLAKLPSIMSINKGTVNSSVQGLETTNKCILKITKKNITSSYNDKTSFDRLYGRPCMKQKALSACYGYTVVGDINLDGFTIATVDEVSEIKNILQSGALFREQTP